MRKTACILGCVILMVASPAYASFGRQPIWTIEQIAAYDASDYAYIQTLQLMRSLDGLQGVRKQYERAIEIWEQWPVK